MHRHHLWLLLTLLLLILTEDGCQPQRCLGQPILLQEITHSLDEHSETFWRSNPFRVADRVMEQVLNHEADDHGALLQATTTPLQQSSAFTRFYNGNVPSHVSSNCSIWWVRLAIAYNGSAFQSYQKQGADIPTV